MNIERTSMKNYIKKKIFFVIIKYEKKTQNENERR